MDLEARPAKRRRLGAHGMMFRRRRVFARLREGLTYDEIASEEGVSSARVRQIVTEELQKRAVDSGADHAKLQLDRLAPAVQLGAQAIAAGDISAISPYLKALDRLDRYQTVAAAHQGYDEEDRRKLMEKINRLVENLGVDETWNAAREYLKKHGYFPADPRELFEAEGQEADPAGSPEFSEERIAPEASPAEAPADSGFFYLNRP
jgi:predicted transcriptional regulator